MYEIIRVTQDDKEYIKAVANFIFQCWGENEKPLCEIVEFCEHAVCENRVPQSFVALDGKKPVGSFQLGLNEPFTRPDLTPWLMNVFVLPEMRGKGVGRAMMESVDKFAREINLTQIYLFTPHNGFYEKFGWERCGSVPFFEGEQREEVPMYVKYIKY